MAEINQEETQQELFEQFAGSARKPERFLPQNKINKPILFSTSVEQVILISITLILVCCFVFFLGVLRGKSLKTSPLAAAMVYSKKPVSLPVPVVSAAPVRSAAASEPVRLPGPQQAQVVEVSSTTKPYTVQLATYKKQELAEKEVVTLRRSGYFSTIIPSDGYYQVCVGQYATKDEAKKDLKNFSAKYKGCFLRRR